MLYILPQENEEFAHRHAAQTRKRLWQVQSLQLQQKTPNECAMRKLVVDLLRPGYWTIAVCLLLVIYCMPPLTQRLRMKDRRQATQTVSAADAEVTAVLIMASTRPEVQLLVRQVLALRPDPALFPVIVSQDGRNAMTSAALAPLAGEVEWLQLPEEDPEGSWRRRHPVDRITRHYRRALDFVFRGRGYRRVIVLEDDLLLAADFFAYFLALAPVLDLDPSVFCVSAWSDNAMLGLVDTGPAGAATAHRTDFFPGLGWMIRRPAWELVRAEWPKREFDSYLRRRMLKAGLVCIRPEVPRVFNTGQAGGTAMPGWYGQTFHRRFLSRMAFNLLAGARIPEAAVRRLAGGPASDAQFASWVNRLPAISRARLLRLARNESDGGAGDRLPPAVQVAYGSAREYTELALRLGLIPDVWFGVPRCSRRGIVELRLGVGGVGGCVRVFLRPVAPWPIYSRSVYVNYAQPAPLHPPRSGIR